MAWVRGRAAAIRNRFTNLFSHVVRRGLAEVLLMTFKNVFHEVLCTLGFFSETLNKFRRTDRGAQPSGPPSTEPYWGHPEGAGPPGSVLGSPGGWAPRSV